MKYCEHQIIHRSLQRCRGPGKQQQQCFKKLLGPGNVQNVLCLASICKCCKYLASAASICKCCKYLASGWSCIWQVAGLVSGKWLVLYLASSWSCIWQVAGLVSGKYLILQVLQVSASAASIWQVLQVSASAASIWQVAGLVSGKDGCHCCLSCNH